MLQISSTAYYCSGTANMRAGIMMSRQTASALVDPADSTTFVCRLGVTIAHLSATGANWNTTELAAEQNLKRDCAASGHVYMYDWPQLIIIRHTCTLVYIIVDTSARYRRRHDCMT